MNAWNNGVAVLGQCDLKKRFGIPKLFKKQPKLTGRWQILDNN